MTSEALIAPSAHFMLLAALLGASVFGLWSESRPLGKTVSGVVVAMGTAMVLANIGVLPSSAPVYDSVWSFLVPVAIPLLLLKANLKKIISETGGMLVAFLLGAVGTVCGVLLGFLLLPVGEGGADLAAALAASYIGGSLNYAAMAEVLQIDNELLAAGAAADNVVIIFFYMALGLMASSKLLMRFLPSKIIADATNGMHERNGYEGEPVRLCLLDLGLALFIAFAICAVGNTIASALSIERYAVLLITVIAVAVANLFPKRLDQLSGDFELGLLIMYLFFASVGAGTDLAVLIDSALIIVLFVVVIVVVHMFVILLGSRMFRLDLAEVIIASNACASGPTTAAAFAASKGWRTLITPAIMCGVFGYVIANFVGVLMSDWLTAIS